MLLTCRGPSGCGIMSKLRGKGDGGIDSCLSMGPSSPEQASLFATGSRLSSVSCLVYVAGPARCGCVLQEDEASTTS